MTLNDLIREEITLLGDLHAGIISDENKEKLKSITKKIEEKLKQKKERKCKKLK